MVQGSRVTYRRGVVNAIAFLWGLQFAFLSPALALLLVNLFGASTGQVSVVLVIYNGACLLAAWSLPRWADRRGDYVRPMVGCAVFTVALSVALGATDQLTFAVAGLVLLGAPAAVGTPLLFGFVRHCGASPSEVVRTRAVFSMAWVAGPPAAAAVISVAGGHTLVWAIGAVGACNIVATSLLPRVPVRRRDGAASPPDESRAGPPASRSLVVVLVAAFALLQASSTASVLVTTLFVTHILGRSPLFGGVALGVAAGLEVPVLLLLGRQARRAHDLRLLGLACGLGVAYYVVMATAQNAATVIAAQVLNAGFYGVVAGVGLTLFQAVIPGPAAAAGLLSNAQRAGALLSGFVVGAGTVFAGGLRAVFVTCAVLTVVGALLVQVAARHPHLVDQERATPSPTDPVAQAGP